MATKIRRNSFLPGYHSAKDLSGETNSNWTRYYQDNNFVDLFFNSSTRSPVNGYSGHAYSKYDKEMLKQTMLQHEATFQKQVYELHRIYRVQKDLMDEFKIRGTCRSSLPRETSQSNSFISEMHFGCSQKVRQSHLLVGNAVCGNEHSPHDDDPRSHFSFMKEVNFPSSSENRHLKDNELEYDNVHKSRSHPRRMLDLRLSADVYIEIEDSVTLEKNNVDDSASRAAMPIDGIHTVQGTNAQLALGIGGNSNCREDNWLASSKVLNNPREVHPNETSTATDHERLAIPASQVASDSSPTSKEIKHEWQFLNGNSGKRRCDLRFFSENLGKDRLSESVQSNLKISHELISLDHKKPRACVGQKLKNIESSTQTFHQILSDSSDFISRSIFSSLNVSQYELPKSLHLLGSSQAKPQTVSPFYPNKFYNNLLLDSVSGQHLQLLHCKSNVDYNNNSDDTNVEGHRPRKCFKGFQSRRERTANEMYHSQICLTGNYVGLTTRQDAKIHDEVKKYSEFPDSLRVKSYSNKDDSSNASKAASTYLNKYSKLIYSPSSIASEMMDNKDKSVSLCNLKEVQPKLQAKDHSTARTETSDHAHKTMTGFPFFDRVHQSAKLSPLIPHHEQSLIYDTKSLGVNGSFHTDVDFSTKSFSLKKKMDIRRLTTERHIENRTTNVRNAIDLNEEAPGIDDTKLLEVLPEDEARIPSSCSIPSLNAKNAFDIFVKTSPSYDGSCTRIHHDSNPSYGNGYSQDKESSFDAHVRLAAESIFSMSKDKSNHSQQSFPLQCDTLRWFADIVSSNSENTTVQRVGDICNQSSDDGLDLFEAMTLKLRETSVDHFICNPHEVNDIEAKQENSSLAALLFTKPRRGQTRRRQQQQNFQKDVLQGFASLSKDEITEDFQAVGGLKEVSGRPRNSGRRVNSKAKGRRKPRNSVVTVHEFSSPQAVQQNEAEIQGIEKTMVGWGRTTRRCCRQRCFPGYVRASLDQE